MFSICDGLNYRQLKKLRVSGYHIVSPQMHVAVVSVYWLLFIVFSWLVWRIHFIYFLFDGENYRQKKTYSFWLPYSKASDACRCSFWSSAGFYCFLLAGESNWSRTVSISRSWCYRRRRWCEGSRWSIFFDMGRTIYRKKENLRVAPCSLHRQDIIVFSWPERKTEVEQQE